MNIPRRLWSQIRSCCQRREVKREIDEELRFHLEQRTADNLAAGMSPEDAAREARKRFGNLQSVREECRERRAVHLGETCVQDVRFSLRLLRKSLGFSTIAVMSLAMGIGANTAIFSLVNAILLRSLPVPNPQELRVIQWSGRAPQTGWFSGSLRPVSAEAPSGSHWLRVGNSPEQRVIADAFTFSQYRALREQCTAQAEIFGYIPLHGATVRARSEPFVAQGLIVTGNFFSGLGVQPLLGRLFTTDDDLAGAAPVIAITHGWWEKQFNLDPAVLGQTMTLNGHSYTVVGVLPRHFTGVGLKVENEFYVPMSAQPQLMSFLSQTAPDHWWVQLMARTRPGATDAQLLARLDVVFSAQAASVMKEPKIELSVGRAGPSSHREFYRKPLLILLGVVGTVLLVACVNLAGLSLARGAARQHELAVRAALGASRRRLIRQSLTESLLLAALGGALGILLAVWAKTAVSRLLAGSQEGLRYDLSLDLTVLGFTLLVALVTALLSGLLPALRAGRADPLAGLKSCTMHGVPRLRTGRILVSAQVALSLTLLVGAGLYVRTLVNLVTIDPGFAKDNVLLFQLNPASGGMRDAAVTSFYDRVQQALAAIPGVRSAALVNLKLLGGAMSGGGFFKLPSHPELNERKPQAHRLTVGETFFATMDIPILAGRGFTAADREGAPKVVIVNETFARSYLPDEDAVGQNLRAGEFNGTPMDWEIVGVCRDAKYTGIKTDVPPTVYFSYRQDRVFGAYFAVRTAVPPLSLVSSARKAVSSVDPNVPLSDITTQKAVRDQGISQEWMFATLCGALAALAVLLAGIGLYGLMAYTVSRRMGEIGIRMALGASRRRIVMPILREALGLTAAGVVIGAVGACWATRLIQSQLFGVEACDPPTFAAAALLLLLLSSLAAWIPARRAAKVDPMLALRSE